MLSSLGFRFDCFPPPSPSCYARDTEPFPTATDQLLEPTESSTRDVVLWLAGSSGAGKKDIERGANSATGKHGPTGMLGMPV